MAKTVKEAYGEILRLRNEFYQKWQEVPHEVYDENRGVYKAKYEAFDKALELLTSSIVDPHPESSINKNLEEEVEKYIKENGLDGLDTIEEVKYISHYFANWQKEQIKKNAIEAYVDQVEYPGSTWIQLSENPKDLKDGDDIKIYIIKEK
mgnify:CR=1 FL=1